MTAFDVINSQQFGKPLKAEQKNNHVWLFFCLAFNSSRWVLKIEEEEEEEGCKNFHNNTQGKNVDILYVIYTLVNNICSLANSFLYHQKYLKLSISLVSLPIFFILTYIDKNHRVSHQRYLHAHVKKAQIN